MIEVKNYKSGTYRNNGDFKSFIPSKINDDWSWDDSEINHLLTEAYKEIGALNSYSELIPDIDTYIRMHIHTEANKSNRIEGTNTTIEEDLMSPEDVSPEKRNDNIEVNNYIKALNYGIKRVTEDNFLFSSRLIRELHKILLQGARGEHKTPGLFRESQNFIGGSMPSNARYVPPAMCDLDDAMNDFDKFMNREDNIPVLIRLSIMHYQFETIHPFLDGNGRIGRLMIPLFLLSKNELQKPCFYISEYFEKNRTEYYDALQRTRTNNDMKGWICFFLEATIETAKDAKNKFREVVKQVQRYNEYVSLKKKNSETLNKIIKVMYNKPLANISDIVSATGLSNQTVNTAMKILRDDNVVAEVTGFRRNRLFVLTDYLKIFM